MDVFASSLPINPGKISKDKTNRTKTFPEMLCFLASTTYFSMSTDCFQETFKKTNVRTITHAEIFKTVSKGIGRSPTLTIP